MPLSLRHELVTAPEPAQPLRSLLFLHGILGAGVNLRSLARRFVAQRPEWQGVLVDLRAHGGSLGHDGADSVASAADDVASLAASLERPVGGAVAHSFGGKVALLLSTKVKLAHVALIDSAPGMRFDSGGSDLTLQVISLLDALAHESWASREAFVNALLARGQGRGVAQWLAMNIQLHDGRYHFALELPRIHALLESYASLDAWPVLERASDTMFHLIIGDRSETYDASERARASALAASSNGRITLDVLPSGHWVHVDDFEGLLRVLVNRLPAASQQVAVSAAFV